MVSSRICHLLALCSCGSKQWTRWQASIKKITLDHDVIDVTEHLHFPKVYIQNVVRTFVCGSEEQFVPYMTLQAYKRQVCFDTDSKRHCCKAPCTLTKISRLYKYAWELFVSVVHGYFRSVLNLHWHTLSLGNLLLVHRRKMDQLWVLKWLEIQKQPERASSIHHKSSAGSFKRTLHPSVCIIHTVSLYEWYINHHKFGFIISASSFLHNDQARQKKQQSSNAFEDPDLTQSQALCVITDHMCSHNAENKSKFLPELSWC